MGLFKGDKGDVVLAKGAGPDVGKLCRIIEIVRQMWLIFRQWCGRSRHRTGLRAYPRQHLLAMRQGQQILAARDQHRIADGISNRAFSSIGQPMHAFVCVDSERTFLVQRHKEACRKSAARGRTGRMKTWTTLIDNIDRRFAKYRAAPAFPRTYTHDGELQVPPPPSLSWAGQAAGMLDRAGSRLVVSRWMKDKSETRSGPEVDPRTGGMKRDTRLGHAGRPGESPAARAALTRQDRLHDAVGGFLGGHLDRVDADLGAFGRLIGAVDAGEVLELRPRAPSCRGPSRRAPRPRPAACR